MGLLRGRLIINWLLIANIVSPIPLNSRIVGVKDNSFSFAFVEPEIALKYCSIFPFVPSPAVLESALPIPLINVSIDEDHFPVAMFLAQSEISTIVITRFIGVWSFSRPTALCGFAVILISIWETHECLDYLVVLEDSFEHLTGSVCDGALAVGCSIDELSLKGEDAILEDAGSMRAAICELALICRLIFHF